MFALKAFLCKRQNVVWMELNLFRARRCLHLWALWRCSLDTKGGKREGPQIGEANIRANDHLTDGSLHFFDAFIGKKRERIPRSCCVIVRGLIMLYSICIRALPLINTIVCWDISKIQNQNVLFCSMDWKTSDVIYPFLRVNATFRSYPRYFHVSPTESEIIIWSCAHFAPPSPSPSIFQA